MLLALIQGAGKTVVMIAVIEALNTEFNDTLSGLVFASSALKFQWRDAIAQFTGGTMDAAGNWQGGASCIVVDGSRSVRSQLYKRIQREHPQYVILGYEQVVSDYPEVIRLPRDFMIADEVVALRNPASKRSRTFKTLDAPFVFGLSGTPMENGKPDEIFSIMEWIDHSVLGRADLFDRTFVSRNNKGWIIGYKNLPRLHEMMSEAMVRIRRDDPEVVGFMPRRHPPLTHLVPLDAATAGVYRYIAADLAGELATAIASRRAFDVLALYAGNGGKGDEMQGRIAARITALRMLLTHPQVLQDSAERFDNGVGGSEYANDLLRSGALMLPATGAKMDAVIDRIDEVLCEDPENKIIVFSFFKGALRLLADAYGPEAVQFHGGMNASRKAAAKRRFQHDPKIRLFLSSDAGGYGVDLPQANWLINVDLPFSRGKADQRNSRHDRASSLHEVIHTETFLVAGSIEEYYAARLADKGGVARAIIDGRGADRRGRLTLSATTLLAWLGEHDMRQAPTVLR